MWQKIVQFSVGPRTVLRRLLALNDSAHAIALGVAVGVFVGLTPTVGVQTILILGLVLATRRFVYFNATAAMASTYISNPVTMVPMYYGWYRIGAWFSTGSLSAEEFEAMLQFQGLSGWWEAMCALGSQVALPMFVGALLTAPIGVAIAYPVTYFLVKWIRDQKPSSRKPKKSSEERVPDASSDPGVERRIDSTEQHSASSGKSKPGLARVRPASLQPEA